MPPLPPLPPPLPPPRPRPDDIERPAKAMVPYKRHVTGYTNRTLKPQSAEACGQCTVYKMV